MAWTSISFAPTLPRPSRCRHRQLCQLIERPEVFAPPGFGCGGALIECLYYRANMKQESPEPRSRQKQLPPKCLGLTRGLSGGSWLVRGATPQKSVGVFSRWVADAVASRAESGFRRAWAGGWGRVLPCFWFFLCFPLFHKSSIGVALEAGSSPLIYRPRTSAARRGKERRAPPQPIGIAPCFREPADVTHVEDPAWFMDANSLRSQDVQFL
jgi:hypothetical protein